MIVAKVMLNSSKLRKHREQLGPRANKILDRSATQIQARAIRNTKAQKLIDTGAMANGWRVETPSEYKRRIFNTQHYAFYWEVGHHNTIWGTQDPGVWVPARPMLTPAVEKYRQKLRNSWAKLFSEDQGGGGAE